MTTAPIQLLPWQDRWTNPSLYELLEPLEDQHRGALDSLLEKIEGYETLDKSLVWLGQSWHWTIQYRLLDPRGNELDTLCYIVPNHITPKVCVPLTDKVLQQIPFRRLAKLVRLAIIDAKRPVAVYWVTLNLTASYEVDPIFDLIKRKHNILMEPFKPAKKSSAK